MTDLTRRPERLDELLEICVQVEIAFAHLQVQARANIIPVRGPATERI